MIRFNARAHTDDEGDVDLSIRTPYKDADVEVTLAVEAVPGGLELQRGDHWPEGFLESTFGSLAEDSIESAIRK